MKGFMRVGVLAAAVGLMLGMGEPPKDAPATTGADAPKVMIDPAYLEYKGGAQGVAGNLKSIGSDTMNNLMTFWFEAYKTFYPNIKTEVEGKGSSTAPPALTEGLAQFGPMSRPMKKEEIDDFEKKHGYKPTELRTGLDTLAVYVHKDNPIQSLTLEQVRKIFSVDGPDMKWGELGLTGEWADKPISLYGRNSSSGTYGFFKDHALGKKDFKPTVKEQPGSSSVVTGVAGDKFAIGYCGIGYKSADVRAIPLAGKDGKPYEPNQQNALSGKYPLGRYLYIYINYKPGTEIEPLRAEFIKMIYSKQGQEIVVKDGYDPLPASVARAELQKIGISPNF